MEILSLSTKQTEIKCTNSDQSRNSAGGPKFVHSVMNILAGLPVQRNFSDNQLVDGEHN